MNFDDLTPVVTYGDWCAKREDCYAPLGADSPNGSKVRQYCRMASLSPGAPMLAGCSADSMMQVYVAAAARHYGVPGIVYVPNRKNISEATKYALDMGCEVNGVHPGYLSVCRARARTRAKELGNIVVRWMPDLAIQDTVRQCSNIPSWVRRVVVPTGSGLTAAAVIIAVPSHVSVLAVCVSDMASYSGIMGLVEKHGPAFGRFIGPIFGELPSLDLVKVNLLYGEGVDGHLPDGISLDPFYAAKALPYIEPGDCLWITGCRPRSAFPASFHCA